MARPLSASEMHRSGLNGNHQGRFDLDARNGAADDVSPDDEDLRHENAQLRALCGELEQALHEATQPTGGPLDWEERAREYETLIDEKTELIRTLHEQLQDAQDIVADAENRANQAIAAKPAGPMPREAELLTLSEELERERRQLQEDEESLMEQMRQMEVSMARERAEMARQRNDLQRLYAEIRHEIERLERNGALQSKIDRLKSKLQDATNRRGSAPTSGTPAPPTQTAPPAPAQAPTPAPPSRKEGASFMGRLFGK